MKRPVLVWTCIKQVKSCQFNLNSAESQKILSHKLLRAGPDRHHCGLLHGGMLNLCRPALNKKLDNFCCDLPLELVKTSQDQSMCFHNAASCNNDTVSPLNEHWKKSTIQLTQKLRALARFDYINCWIHDRRKAEKPQTDITQGCRLSTDRQHGGSVCVRCLSLNEWAGGEKKHWQQIIQSSHELRIST